MYDAKTLARHIHEYVMTQSGLETHMPFYVGIRMRMGIIFPAILAGWLLLPGDPSAGQCLPHKKYRPHPSVE